MLSRKTAIPIAMHIIYACTYIEGITIYFRSGEGRVVAIAKIQTRTIKLLAKHAYLHTHRGSSTKELELWCILQT